MLVIQKENWINIQVWWFIKAAMKLLPFTNNLQTNCLGMSTGVTTKTEWALPETPLGHERYDSKTMHYQETWDKCYAEMLFLKSWLCEQWQPFNHFIHTNFRFVVTKLGILQRKKSAITIETLWLNKTQAHYASNKERGSECRNVWDNMGTWAEVELQGQ